MKTKTITLEIKNQGKAPGTLGWLLEQNIKIEIERKTFTLDIRNDQVEREALAATVFLAGKSQVVAIEGLAPLEPTHSSFYHDAEVGTSGWVYFRHLNPSPGCFTWAGVTYTKAADSVLEDIVFRAKEALEAHIAARDEEEAAFEVELTLKKLEA